MKEEFIGITIKILTPCLFGIVSRSFFFRVVSPERIVGEKSAPLGTNLGDATFVLRKRIKFEEQLELENEDSGTKRRHV